MSTGLSPFRLSRIACEVAVVTPDEFAAARGHKLGRVNNTGNFVVRSCKRCGLRLVVSEENPNGFGGAIEKDCSRSGSDAA